MNPLQVHILRSGSAGNALVVRCGRTVVLVDAGLTAEATVQTLARFGLTMRDLTAILLTHEHDDHARGAGAIARLSGAPVLATEGTLRRADGWLQGAATERFRPSHPFMVGTLTVEGIPIRHDGAEPVAFVIQGNGSRAVIACDLGDVDEALAERLPDADLVLLEANYDLRLLGVSGYPWFLKNRIIGGLGHLSNEGAARAVVRAARGGRAQTVVLLHLSEVNNLAPLARDTVRWALEREHLTTTRLEVVRPNASGPAWESSPQESSGSESSPPKSSPPKSSPR